VSPLEASGDELQVFDAFKNNLKGVVSVVYSSVYGFFHLLLLIWRLK
jgi:hypothetical protein